MAGRRGMVSGGGAGGGGGGGLGPIASLTFLGNPTGAPAVPTAQSMTAAVFLWAALALGAADTVVKVNGGGTALEYGKITANNISDGAVTLAKLANGTNPGALLWWTGAAWIETASGTVETDGTSISFGSNPSASGVIRLSATSHIWAKTGGGTDVILIGETGGNVEIGMNNAAVAVILAQVGTGGIHRWSVAGAVEMSLNNSTLDLNQNSITDVSFIAAGTDPAGSGQVRLSNFSTGVQGIVSKTASGDIPLITGNSTTVIVGGDATITQMRLRVPTAASFAFDINGIEEYTLNATTLACNQNSITGAGFITIGTDPATSGAARFTNNDLLAWKTNGGTTLQMLQLSSADLLIIGSSNAAHLNTDLHVGASGGQLSFKFAGTVEYAFTATNFTILDNEIRTTGSSTGAKYNAPNAVSIIEARNAAAGGDLPILTTSASDEIIFGGANILDILYRVQTGRTHRFQVNNADEMILSSTALQGLQNALTDWGFMELGPTPVATAGQLRVHNQFQLQARNGANTNDYLVLWLNGDFITLGNGGTVTAGLILQGGNGSIEFHSNAGGTRAEMTSSHFRLTDIPLTWGNTYSIPTVQQEIDTAASSATNRTLTLAAQDKSGTTNVTACDVLVRGGDATGASGTRNGGDCISRAGTGVTQDGSWQVLSAGAIIAEVARVANTRRVFAFCRAAPLTTSQMPTNTGDMVMYVGNATIAPSFVVGTNPPASGVIVFSEAACLSTVNSGNVRYDLCPADQGGTSNITTSKVVLRSARTNTANATPVNLDTFTPGTNTVVVVIARVRARDRTADDHAGYVLHACFKRRAAGTTIVGAVAATLTAESDATWAATLDTDGANAIRVRITGDATNVVDWDVDWEIHYTTV